jgi:hypothetical protein
MIDGLVACVVKNRNEYRVLAGKNRRKEIAWKT